MPNIKLGMIFAHIQNINISYYGKKFRKGNQCHEVGADEVWQAFLMQEKRCRECAAQAQRDF